MSGFFTAGPDGQPVHINGDRRMDERTLGLLMHAFGLACEQYNKEHGLVVIATHTIGASQAEDSRLVLDAVYPHRTALRWMNEVPQRIGSAVMRFIDYGAGQASKPSDEEVVLIRAYFEYYVNAPSWGAPTAELSALRAQIVAARTLEELDAWVDACEKAGLDPL